MLIRPVTLDDKPEWLRMRLALWPDSAPEQEATEMDALLAGYPSPTLMVAFVAVRPEGGLCGLVEVSIHASAPGCETDRVGYLEAWYVDEDWRGRGLGRALVGTAAGGLAYLLVCWLLRVEEWRRVVGMVGRRVGRATR